MLTYIILFVVTMVTTLLTICLFQRIFYKFDILDNPKKYGKERAPVPYGMGVIFFLVFFLLSYFFIDPSYKLYLIWFFGGLVTAVSFIDDRLKVSPKWRLLMQVCIGMIIGITSIKIGYVSSIFGGIIDLKTHSLELFGMEVFIIPLVFTVIWYVFVFNALNWTDGIQGNTTSLSIISFFVIFLLGLKLYITDDHSALRNNAEFIMQITLILVGILIPFWFFDIKEKLLMGDTGTMFLGFMLATIAIISGGKIATVLVVFGIYAVDALYVVVRRIFHGKNPLQGDFTHLHHRLLDLGLSHTQILAFVGGLSFVFGVMSLFLDKFGKILIFGVIILVVVFLNQILEKFYSIPGSKK